MADSDRVHDLAAMIRVLSLALFGLSDMAASDDLGALGRYAGDIEARLLALADEEEKKGGNGSNVVRF